MSGSLTRRLGYAIGLGTAGFAAADAVNLYSNQGTLASRFQEDIIFPLDLNRSSGSPYMGMRFREYYRRSIRDQPFFRDVTKIKLPIPSNLVEQTSLNYEKENLGTALGAAVDALSGAGESRPSLAQAVSQIATGVGAAGVSSGLGAALGNTNLAQGVASAVSVVTGITTNPFQVILFKNPNFRSHQFSWKFIPHSKQESDELKKLIDTIRYHSLPGISRAAGVFFSYPEILEISFYPTDAYLYKFKPCVVDTITVNYAPNGPSFFKSSKAPAAIEVTIRLQEIEIWTKADDIRVNGRLPGDTLTVEEELAQREGFLRGAQSSGAQAGAVPGASDGNQFGLR